MTSVVFLNAFFTRILPDLSTRGLCFAFGKTLYAYCSDAFKRLVGQSGLEPPTSRLSVVCSNQLSYWPSFLHKRFGGDKRDRTADLLLAKQALSQLSYTPIWYFLFNVRFREPQKLNNDNLEPFLRISSSDRIRENFTSQFSLERR